MNDLMPGIVEETARRLIEAVTLSKDDLPTDSNETTVLIIDDTLDAIDFDLSVRVKIREILQVKRII